MTWALTPLTEEQRAIQSTAREFAQRELAPHVDRVGSRSAHFEPIADSEAGRARLPRDDDARGVRRSRARHADVPASRSRRSPPSTRRSPCMMSVHNSLPTQMILRCGRCAAEGALPAGRWRAARCSARSRCPSRKPAPTRRRCARQAVRDGDDWVLNGTKAWVSSGTDAGVILAMARTDTARRPQGRARHRRVHHHARPPRLPRRQEGGQDGAARVADRAAPLRRHARPGANLLGEPGMGFIYAMQSLDTRPTRHRRAGDRHRAGRADARVAVRRRAPAVRQADQGIPGHSVQARRHGDARRGVARAAARRRDREGPRRAHHAVQLDGQAASRARPRCG